MLKNFLQTVSTRAEYLALGLAATGLATSATINLLIRGEIIIPKNDLLVQLIALPTVTPLLLGASAAIIIKESADIALALLNNTQPKDEVPQC
jgi:hypothetical protein